MPKRKNGGDENLFSKIGKAARSAGAAAGSAGAAGLKAAAKDRLKKTLMSRPGIGQEFMDEYKPMLVTRLIESKERLTESKESPTPRQEMVRSTPLQERQSFDIQEIQKPETMSFKNTAIERLRD